MKAIRAIDTWAKAGVYYVRTEAMVLGFNIELQGEFDTDTADSEYILVTDDDGKPLSTCRINANASQGYAKIERVATVSTARHCGAGRLAIEEAEQWILEKGIHKIIITSRDEAVGFYEKLGYKADYTKDCNSFAHKADDKIQDRKKPQGRFVIVYMEKDV